MDDSLDDLFSDEPLVEISSLPGLSSISRGLIQSVDDARVSGCSQKIAWSNQGCIASISNDGHSVNLRNLYCNPATGLWTLSDGEEAKIIALSHNGYPLKHLSWSHSGTELAVTDILGNISVFSPLLAINRCTVSRRCILGAEDNLSVIVGLAWLNQDRSLPLHRPAVKAQNGQWAFMGSRFKQTGPHNPHLIGDQPGKNKAALVTVTRTGLIRLIYQGSEGARWVDFKGELHSISTAAELLTHATICADKDSSMLVATYGFSKQIRLYRVVVEWSKQSFLIENVKTIADCSSPKQDVDTNELPSSLPYPEAQLYHLEMLSHAPDLRSKETFPPLLLAFFCNYPQQNSPPSVVNEPWTSIARWELNGTKPTLHPSFSQLSSKKPNAPTSSELQAEVVLKRLPDISLGNIISSVQQLNLGTTLAFCSSDGSVDFRSRPALDLLPRDDSSDKASGLAQVGLSFPQGDNCASPRLEPVEQASNNSLGLHAALSPNACAVVTLDDGYMASLRLMQIHQGYFDSPLSDAIVEAVAEAFVTQFSISCSSYGNYHDDLSATMQLFQEQNLKHADSVQVSTFTKPFLSDIHRVISLNIDYSGDVKTENYLKNGMHQRTLSMQLSLSYQSSQKYRNLSSKVAFATLQLRWAAWSFAMGLKLSPTGTGLSGEADLRRTAWTLSLMNFIVDELFTLATAMDDASAAEGASPNHDMVASKISELNTPALALLFVSQSRLLFKYNFRFFRSLCAEIAQQRSQDPTWRELGSIFSRSPVPLQSFERVLADVDANVRNVYDSEHIPEADRKDIETNMLITGTVSARLWPAVEALLTKTVRALRDETNVAELYFHDVSWLGLSDDGASDQWRKEHRLDVIRKTEIPKAAKVRQCTRCCSVMEDTAPPKGTAGWIVNMWRTCVCGNWWMSMKDEGNPRDRGG
ncbi:MAG: hypothetical protein Q9206_000986 [Seirophora lacunosa]